MPVTRTSTAPRELELTVDRDRMLRRLSELGRIGGDDGGGVTRLGFSAEDREAQRYLSAEARKAGLDARVDQAGNLVFRRRGADDARPKLLMGSHADTVINGGRLDGAYGVIAALEALQVCAEHDVELSQELVAVAFANEEGALFPQPFWGSLALTGQFDRLPAEPVDRFGQSLRDPLRLAGGDLDALRDAAWPAGSISAYLELHIEQGPVLERAGVPIGVVEAIVGRTVFEVEIAGNQGHAGTTPMDDRRDALVAASHVVLAAERIAKTGTCRVATTGRLSVQPDATNVIPGRVAGSVEFRDGAPDRIACAEREFLAELAAIRASTGCVVTAEVVMRTVPTQTAPSVRTAIETAANHLGLPTLTLPSGAGHDAQVVAAMAPVGMVFVPSRDGASHVPHEHTDAGDLVAGANVLLRTALLVAG